jgi:hypothetical protein
MDFSQGRPAHALEMTATRTIDFEAYSLRWLHGRVPARGGVLARFSGGRDG